MIGLTDGELVERFTTRGPDAASLAFEALVNRHGPMVVRVARSLLRNPHDVDDAFQATFLVLARKAKSLGERELLAPWLYGVAHRVALKARTETAKRSQRQQTLDDDPPVEPSESPWLDLRPILLEEVARLPEKYRKPVVLCHFQDLTHAEAAQELGWPVGTVSVRLARARKLLRERVERRGLTHTASVWAAGLGLEGVSSLIPSTLLRSTVSAAVSPTTGAALAAGALGLAERTLAMSLMSRLKWAVVPLSLACGAAGGVIGYRQLATPTLPPIAEARRKAKETPPSPTKVEPPLYVRDGQVVFEPPPGYFDLPAPPQKNDGTDPPVIKVGQWVRVEVLEALPGRPIAWNRIVRPDGTISLDYYGELRVAGLNRYQAKCKLIEHLRKYIRDEPLGLITLDDNYNVSNVYSALDSNRVFVDDCVVDPPSSKANQSALDRDHLGKMEGRIEILANQIKYIQDVEKSNQDGRPKDGAEAKPQSWIMEELEKMEEELRKMIKELKDLQAEIKSKETPNAPETPAAKPAGD